MQSAVIELAEALSGDPLTLCRRCKHCADISTTLPYCTHPSAGKGGNLFFLCATQRGNAAPGPPEDYCEPHAKYFEEKQCAQP